MSQQSQRTSEHIARALDRIATALEELARATRNPVTGQSFAEKHPR
jgi:hypothetical protein